LFPKINRKYLTKKFLNVNQAIGLPTAISQWCQGCPCGGFKRDLVPLFAGAVFLVCEKFIRMAFSMVGEVGLFAALVA
jgi:hypothetical protein